jgi:electron transfer flavoprotein beta subunit
MSAASLPVRVLVLILRRRGVPLFDSEVVTPRSMKILVPVKRVVDYNVKIRVKGDGSGRRACQCEDVDEPVRRDRGRGGDPPEGSRQGDEIVVVSIGPAQAQETLRTALAMGADRAILVKVDEDLVEPLGVAKILKGVAEAEQPGLIILGKQAIDDDANQTGQMLAALLGWAQATFASKVEIDDGKAKVTREVDGGLQTIEVKLPAIVTTDLRLNQPRYASLPNIMKAKKKPLDEKTPADFGADVKPRLKVVKTEEPGGRKAGVKVKTVAGTGVEQAQDRRRRASEGGQSNDRKGSRNDNGNSSSRRTRQRLAVGPDRQGADGRLKIGSDVDVLVAGKGAKAAADAAAKLSGRAQGPARRADELAERLAEPLAALVVSLAGNYDAIVAAATSIGQERHAARGRPARRDAGVGDHRGRLGRHVQASDLCRQRHPDGAVDRRQEGHHGAHRLLPGGRRRRLGAGRDGFGCRPIRASRPSSRIACRRATVRS